MHEAARWQGTACVQRLFGGGPCAYPACMFACAHVIGFPNSTLRLLPASVRPQAIEMDGPRFAKLCRETGVQVRSSCTAGAFVCEPAAVLMWSSKRHAHWLATCPENCSTYLLSSVSVLAQLPHPPFVTGWAAQLCGGGHHLLLRQGQGRNPATPEMRVYCCCVLAAVKRGSFAAPWASLVAAAYSAGCHWGL
jgi:hypothetical protein